jgi:hypothetical protein
MGTGSRKTTILLLLSLIRRCCNLGFQLYRVGLLSTFFLLVRCYYTVIHQNEISESFTVKHLPAWFPGAGFKRTAARWAQTLTEMTEGPHQYVKQQMVSRISVLFASLNTNSSLCRRQAPRNHHILPACLKRMISLLKKITTLNGLHIHCMQVAQIPQVLTLT